MSFPFLTIWQFLLFTYWIKWKGVCKTRQTCYLCTFPTWSYTSMGAICLSDSALTSTSCSPQYFTFQTETTTNRFILKIQDDRPNNAISPDVTGIHWEKIASFVAVVWLVCLIFPQQTSSFFPPISFRQVARLSKQANPTPASLLYIHYKTCNRDLVIKNFCWKPLYYSD